METELMKGESMKQYQERKRILNKELKPISQMRYIYNEDAISFCKKLGFIYKEMSLVSCSVPCDYQITIYCIGPYGQKVYINIDENNISIYQNDVNGTQKWLSKNNQNHFRIIEEMGYRINYNK